MSCSFTISQFRTVTLIEYVTTENNVTWQKVIVRTFTRINDTRYFSAMKRSGKKILYFWLKLNISSQLTFYVLELRLNRSGQLNFYENYIIALPWDVRARTRDINWFLNFSNWYLGNGFVKISATCSLAEICSIWVVLFTTYDLKWFNLTDKCLVSARVLWLVTISMQILLYSMTLHITLGTVLGIG